jgi:hypothetical protein
MGQLENPVGKRGLAMVYMGDDREIADTVHDFVGGDVAAEGSAVDSRDSVVGEPEGEPTSCVGAMIEKLRIRFTILWEAT